MPLTTVALWFGAIGAVVLPVLSWVGYPPYAFEYVMAGSVVLALALVLRPARPALAACLALMVAALNAVLYFAGAIMAGPALIALCTVMGLALVTIAVFDPAIVLRMVGAAGLAQITVAAVLTPSSAQVREPTEPIEKNDRPSVVHILLDEHAGLAAVPGEAIPERRRLALEKAYIDLGFLLFRRAYSADRHTQTALARVFNPELADPAEALDLVEEGSRWNLRWASALRLVARRRILDLTYFDFVSLAPVAASQTARQASFDTFVGYPHLVRHGVAYRDRLCLAAGAATTWMRRHAHSPLATWFLEATVPGRRLGSALQPAARTQPLVSRSILLDLTDRLACCGARGTYVFAHVLLPHYPYAFDAECRLRPVREWVNRVVHRYGDSDTLASRRMRYRRHFEQAECVARDVTRLMEALRRRPELADATVILHGDHGSRIAIEDRGPLAAAGYDEKTYERDWRATFLAIHIPSVAGRAIDMPVRIDQVLNGLLEGDFASLQLDDLQPTPDSPY